MEKIGRTSPQKKPSKKSREETRVSRGYLEEETGPETTFEEDGPAETFR